MLRTRAEFGMTFICRTAAATALGVMAAVLWTGCEDGGGGGESADLGMNDPNTVVAMGDSITAGGYPGILAGMTGKRIVDAGRGGAVSAEGASQIGGLLSRYHPGYVCILYGANDVTRGHSSGEIVANLRSMVQAAKANMTVPVVATLTPMYRSHAAYDPAVDALNSAIRSMVSQENARLANLAGAFGGNESLIGADGLHPTPEGNVVIADVFASKVGRAVAVEEPAAENGG